MRIVFMGTPEFSGPALEALVVAGHEIAAVYCQPARHPLVLQIYNPITHLFHSSM